LSQLAWKSSLSGFHNAFTVTVKKQSLGEKKPNKQWSSRYGKKFSTEKYGISVKCRTSLENTVRNSRIYYT